MAEALYRTLRVLDLSPAGSTFANGARMHCCERMKLAVSHQCTQHPDRYDCPDSLVAYTPVFDEYGLIIHDGGPGYLLITHCCWCGTKLPDSKRDQYFDRLEQLGFTGPGDTNIPDVFKSDAWWQSGA